MPVPLQRGIGRFCPRQKGVSGSLALRHTSGGRGGFRFPPYGPLSQPLPHNPLNRPLNRRGACRVATRGFAPCAAPAGRILRRCAPQNDRGNASAPQNDRGNASAPLNDTGKCRGPQSEKCFAFQNHKGKHTPARRQKTNTYSKFQKFFCFSFFKKRNPHPVTRPSFPVPVPVPRSRSRPPYSVPVLRPKTAAAARVTVRPLVALAL